jgi:large subunit ribosomal protein L21
MYAIIKTGGKQYRVTEGESLLIERLPVAEGDTVDLPTLLFVDGEDVLDGDALGDIMVSARVLSHERGPKLRIVKFKPKRGYKRRGGHRQELTRIEVTSLGRSGGRGKSRAGAAKPAASAEKPAATAKAKPRATAAKSGGTAAKSGGTAAKSGGTAAKSGGTAAKSGGTAAKSGATTAKPVRAAGSDTEPASPTEVSDGS